MSKEEKKPKESKLKKMIQKKKAPRNASFMSNLMTAILIIFTIVLLYSFIEDGKKDIQEISISQLATDIESGSIESLTVKGDEIEAIYKAATEPKPIKKTKKESGTALSDTLSNYGVTAEQLRSVNIAIKDPSGFGYWAMILLPFLLPLFFILFLI